MKKITDKDFRYTPSYGTDIKKRFRKIEAERKAKAALDAAALKAQAELDAANAAEASTKTIPLKVRKA